MERKIQVMLKPEHNESEVMRLAHFRTSIFRTGDFQASVASEYHFSDIPCTLQAPRFDSRVADGKLRILIEPERSQPIDAA